MTKEQQTQLRQILEIVQYVKRLNDKNNKIAVNNYLEHIESQLIRFVEDDTE